MKKQLILFVFLLMSIISYAQGTYTGGTPYAYCYGENEDCQSGCSEIQVKAPYNSNVLVTLKRYDRVVQHAFIEKGEKVSFRIDNGTYDVFFYYGERWDRTKVMKKRTKCGELKGGFTRKESFGKDTDVRLYSQRLYYELILQENGNFRTEDSNAEEAF